MTVVQRVESIADLYSSDVLQLQGEGIGVPLVLLDRLRAVVGCDMVAFNDVDSMGRRHAFMQEATGDGLWEVTDPPVDEDERRFWERYDDETRGCSWPDHARDLSVVRLQSDILSSRQHHQSPEYIDGLVPWEHEMMTAWRGDVPGRTLRLICFRDSGRDFDERDRFVLQLLRPHIRAAYRQARAECIQVTLTARQRDVLALVREGATNYAIGHRLGISEGTVRTHLQNSYVALGVSSRTAAAMALTAMEADGAS